MLIEICWSNVARPNKSQKNHSSHVTHELRCCCMYAMYSVVFVTFVFDFIPGMNIRISRMKWGGYEPSEGRENQRRERERGPWRGNRVSFCVCETIYLKTWHQWPLDTQRKIARPETVSSRYKDYHHRHLGTVSVVTNWWSLVKSGELWRRKMYWCVSHKIAVYEECWWLYVLYKVNT